MHAHPPRVRRRGRSRRDLRWLGLFVVGPVLLTLGLAITVWYTDASELMPSLRSIWLAIHVSVATLSVALFTIGFSLGIIYLVQARLEASDPRPASFMDRLPDARALERLTYAIHVVAFPLWSFTLIAGAIWARQAWGCLLELGPQGGVDLRHLDRLRRLPPRPGDDRPAPPERRVDRARRLRLHHHQLRRRQRLLRRPALLLGALTVLRYTLLRFLVFFGCLAVLWLAGLRDEEDMLMLVVGAALLSAAVSFVVLRRFREDYSAQLATRLEERSAAKQARGPRPAHRRGRRGRRGRPLPRRRRGLPLSHGPEGSP